MWQKYGGQVQFVAVNTDGRDKLHDPNQGIPADEGLRNYIADCGITFPVIHDPASTPVNDIWNKYAHPVPADWLGWPIIFIIGPDGIIRGFDTSRAVPESELDGMILDVVHLRGPVAVEMAMDVSDSMNSPAAGSPDTKFTLMKQAASMVATFLADNAQADDDMGLIWFTDGVTEHQQGANKLFRIVTHSADLIDAINAAGTGTCTAMGPGLQTAFDTLAAEAAATQKKFVVLCTDGIQNIEPNVVEVAGHYQILNQGGWCGPRSSVAEHPAVDIRSYDTAVHTIGIGITATYEPLLQGIAVQTGGFYVGTNDPGTDLDLAYFVELCNCLAMGSPAVVFHRAGTLYAERCEAVERFCLNSSARKLTVMLNWQEKDANSLTFWLHAPDGTLVKLDREMKTFDNYCMATIYLPREQYGARLPHVGHWEMVIRGETARGSAGYHAMAVVEDRDAKLRVEYPGKPYAVGDILPLSVRLSYANKPLAKAEQIVVERSVPRVPVAELLAGYRASYYELRKHLASEESLKKNPRVLTQLKLLQMAKDPRFARLLAPVRSTRSIEEGTLECKREEEAYILPLALEQPGLNSFKVSVRFDAPDGSPVCRTHMVSVHVGPGEADPKRTGVNVVATASKEFSGVLAYISPKNRGGQLLGPGISGEITAFVENESVAIRVLDMADGTYQAEIPIPRKARGKKTPVSILVQGKTMWRGEI